jgi:tetratricopeptide (TPR) repeat protein
MNEDVPIRQRIDFAVAAYEREAFEEALETLDAIIEEAPGFPDVHNKRGLCLAMLGRQEDALLAFERAVQIAPAYAEAHLNRGIILQEFGRFEAAALAFEEASRLDHRDGNAFPSHVGNQIAVQHAKLGDLYLVADHPHDAAREYEAALRVRPRYLDVRTKLAEALLDIGQVSRAIDELEFVLERNPGFAVARLKYGIALHHLGETERAIEEWRRCMAEAPHDMRARAYLASVGVRVGPEPVDED